MMAISIMSKNNGECNNEKKENKIKNENEWRKY
jgi:hypothetical protein